MPYKHNELRRHKIPKAKYTVANWPAYDRALQQRGSLTMWVTPEALAAWTPAQTGRRGRPATYSDLAVETALMLRLAMGRPWPPAARVTSRGVVEKAPMKDRAGAGRSSHTA